MRLLIMVHFGEGISCSRDDVCHRQINANRLIKCFSDLLLFLSTTFISRSLDICAVCDISIILPDLHKLHRDAPPDVESRCASFELSIAAAALVSAEVRARDYSSD